MYQTHHGGDKIIHPGDKSTRTSGINTAKNIINSTISTKGAIFLTFDINSLNLNISLGRYEYMVINLSSLPYEVIDEYNLLELAHERRVYIEIQK
jgi:hypothetical protein